MDADPQTRAAVSQRPGHKRADDGYTGVGRHVPYAALLVGQAAPPPPDSTIQLSRLKRVSAQNMVSSVPSTVVEAGHQLWAKATYDTYVSQNISDDSRIIIPLHGRPKP